ncbi:MAG: aminoglycoside phosphotransferase family protein [Paracoccaceae bacterium]
MTSAVATIDAALAKRLIEAQFSQWSDLAVRAVRPLGTDNAIFHLGPDMCIRLPRIERAAHLVETELRWLTHLAPLPLKIPTPLGTGAPDVGYPWNWAVYDWLPGENPDPDNLPDLSSSAVVLAEFITALQATDAASGPPSGARNEFRGVPLHQRDQLTSAAINSVSDMFDVGALSAAWQSSLDARQWSHEPVWLHGDLHPGNLLAQRGQIIAVIDFGLMGVGDPACDLMAAWTFLDANARATFRPRLAVDDATWARGRGWALSFALIALAYYRSGKPGLVSTTIRTINQVLRDHRRQG